MKWDLERFPHLWWKGCNSKPESRSGSREMEPNTERNQVCMIRPSSGFMCVITKNKDSIYYLDVQEQKLDLSEKLCHFVGLSHVFYSLCASSEEGVGATPQH